LGCICSLFLKEWFLRWLYTEEVLNGESLGVKNSVCLRNALIVKDYMKKIFVGNLSFNASEEDIKAVFGAFGVVTEVFLPVDKFSNRPRGFAFVTMEDDAAADKAIAEVNDTEIDGRKVAVNEARPKEERPAGERRSFGGPRRDSRGGGRGGFGGGRGGFGGGRGGRDDRRGGGDRY
jgi:RNA recognition motif-containing protein